MTHGAPSACVVIRKGRNGCLTKPVNCRLERACRSDQAMLSGRIVIRSTKFTHIHHPINIFEHQALLALRMPNEQNR